ncbi:MAG: TRAP transporter small permease subunit [Desulfuromonadales bacterium]|nr:TRAP transporter small permease subunit [Desulfuromonadales bacterium]NIR33902.1 TRAP transporter small permease subunit [Desulfuromonadales bacterium]NIS41441.1 TRAP transporter small permease subunit [Desulfuromonadales bacterium]
MLIVEKSINGLNERVGVLTSYLALPLILVVAYEVLMRYVFNAPTKWAFEATTFLYGVHYMLGIAFTHKHDGHVAIDVFESQLPAKPRKILRIIVNMVLFIPTIGLLSVWSVIYAATSWQNWERASTSWAPPIYPFKTIMAIGFILLFLQGVAKLIHDFRTLNDQKSTSGQGDS